MIHMPLFGQSTLIHMAVDANFPVLVVLCHSLARRGDPLAELLSAPWLLLMTVAFPVALALAGLYGCRNAWRSAGAAARAAAAILAVVSLFGFAHYLVDDRSVAGELFVLLAVAMLVEVPAVRAATSLGSRRSGTVRSALVVGVGWAGRTVIDCTLREPRLRIRVVGILDDDPWKRNVEYKGIPVLGPLDRLSQAAAECRADVVLVAAHPDGNEEFSRSLRDLAAAGVEVADMREFLERATGQVPIKHAEDSWSIPGGTLEPRARVYPHAVKRGVDLACALTGLVFASPLMGIVALLVKAETRGAVFSRKERVGKDEEPIYIVKFRSMIEGSAKDAPALAAVPGSRLSRVGRWLRRTRLDEIPQFINVLRGELSLVGPRAEPPQLAARLRQQIPYYTLRFTVRPGLTGWAQVQQGSGGTREDPIENLKYDLYYVKNLSGRLDVWILMKTFKSVLLARSA